MIILTYACDGQGHKHTGHARAGFIRPSLPSFPPVFILIQIRASPEEGIAFFDLSPDFTDMLANVMYR